MRRPPREHLDILVYARAFGVFFRNPTVIVLPLLVAVIGVLIGQLSGATGGGAAGGITGGLTSFVLLLLELFGLGVSIIIADAGWRTGRASFDDAWQDARRKGGEIIMAAFGFTFVLSIAQYASTIVGAFGLALMALAVYGLIFTIPAAAIGGVPGGAAISASIDRVRSAPLTSAILTIVSIVLLFYFGSFAGPYLDAWLFGLVGETSLAAALIDAVIRSIVTGYLAVVMAKVYADVSFTAPRF